ncbi:MAG: alpha/beta hydrolase, partial [Polyangia bacterium]
MRIAGALLALSLFTAVPAARAATPGYGKRSQVGQLARSLDMKERSARGKAAPRATFVRRQPFLQKVVAFLRPGLSTRDDVRRIERFLTESEARFGGPISTLEHPALVDGRRMRAEKALALIEYGRTPHDVTETFIRTTSIVQGAEELAPRDLFVQRWKPIGKPSGKVFVIAPGFLETGRNYYEQAQLLNAEGHDVVILDQQWAGYTADAQHGVKKGGIDRGFGIARDVAEAAAYGNEIVEKEYGKNPHKQLVLVGTSMGGGPGVLGALALYDAGRISMNGSISKDRGYILQGAFLGRSRSIINDSLDLAGRIPGVKNLPLPALGVPLLNDDGDTNVKIAAHAVEEDIRGRPQAFRAALADINEIRAMVAAHAPSGRGYAIHAAQDHLANPELLVETVRSMNGAVKLDLMPGHDH